MLSIKVDLQPLMSNKTIFSCPHCSDRQCYYTVPKGYCPVCGKRLPQYNLLQKELIKRIGWHFSKELICFL